MNILFYYPSNKRTISIESVIIEFRNQGHTVVLLTQSPKEDLHKELENNNIATYTYVIKKSNAILYYVKHLLYLVKFCKKNKIDIVYSHLQQANIISVFAQYFCKPKFYICRHHSDVSGKESNFNQSLFDKVINRLAKLIIVPSKAVFHQVNINENVNSKKLKLIYYGYDFSKYPSPDNIEVQKIKSQYNCKLLLVKIARLVPGKRYNILFDVLKKQIHDHKKDIKLLVISDGPLYKEFSDYIKLNKLENHIFLLGDQPNIINYLSAADAVPHLSETEASNSVIKEAGLVKKCVLICKQVGDFDDYIKENVSGLFMDKTDPSSDLEKYLNELYNEQIDKDKLGENLYESVNNTFSINQVIADYKYLNQ